jgi:serine phosphatase RsbU (regulator of sigma subunit)
LTTGGMVVGMFPEAEYEEDVADLSPGDVLIAFTDGVPEAHNPAGEEFGEDRLKEIARTTLDLPAAEITSRVAAALKDWIQDAEQYDDMTVVVMKVSAH